MTLKIMEEILAKQPWVKVLGRGEAGGEFHFLSSNRFFFLFCYLEVRFSFDYFSLREFFSLPPQSLLSNVRFFYGE